MSDLNPTDVMDEVELEKLVIENALIDALYWILSRNITGLPYGLLNVVI